MDDSTFDRLTRLVRASGSRRTTGRALLAAVLISATTRSAVADPGDTGENQPCGLRGERCPGRCFTNDCGDELCCSGPEWIICGNTCCQAMNGGRKIAHPCSGACLPPPVTCSTGISGSYRRR